MNIQSINCLGKLHAMPVFLHWYFVELPSALGKWQQQQRGVAMRHCYDNPAYLIPIAS